MDDGQSRTAGTIVVTVLVAALLAGATAVGISLQPWRHHESVLTDQLVIDGLGEPFFGGRVRDNDDPRLRTTDVPADAKVGAWFATPDELYDAEGNLTGTVVVVEAEDSDLADPPADQITVQGAPGTFLGPPDSTVITFGPVGGRIFTIWGAGLDRFQLRAIAEAVRLDGTAVDFTDGSVLIGMERIGSLEDAAAAAFVRTSAQPSVLVRSDLPGAVACYGTRYDAQCLARVAAGDVSEALLNWYFGTLSPVEVRGHSGWARTFTWTEDQLDTSTSPPTFVKVERVTAVVVWHEGGRLLMLNADMTIEELVRLAESIRPATDEEWAAVEAATPF